MKRRVLIALAAIYLMVMCSVLAEESSIYSALLVENEDRLNEECVIAFLEIPGMDCMLPVMQHPEDDGYYLKHNALDEENASGALYTEKTYNNKDFSDPVTVIYGRCMEDGSMFGNLQERFSGSFDKLRKIYLYLPNETCEYTVIAAVPFSNIHILYSYNFQLNRNFNAFFDEVYATRRPGMQLDLQMRPESTEKVLILSTGLKGDVTQRYLVIAKVNRTETN